jgi:hypothetical protein
MEAMATTEQAAMTPSNGAMFSPSIVLASALNASETLIPTAVRVVLKDTFALLWRDWGPLCPWVGELHVLPSIRQIAGPFGSVLSRPPAAWHFSG